MYKHYHQHDECPVVSRPLMVTDESISALIDRLAGQPLKDLCEELVVRRVTRKLLDLDKTIPVDSK